MRRSARRLRRDAACSWSKVSHGALRVTLVLPGLAEPVQVAPDPGHERGFRRPVEQLFRGPVGDADTLVVGIAGRRVMHRNTADELLDRLGYLADRNRRSPFKRQHLPGRCRGERTHVRVGQVLHVHVVALLLAGARDGDRPGLAYRLDEPGHHKLRAHPRPVGDAVAQDGELLPVHLLVAVHEQFRRELGRHVHVPGAAQVDGEVLGQFTGALCGTVDPHRAGQDHPAAAVVPGRLKDPGRALHVEPHRPHRVGRDLVHVGRSGQVEHCGTAGHGRAEPRLVEQVCLNIGRARVAPPRLHVDDPHVVAGPHELVHHVGADEPATSGYS